MNMHKQQKEVEEEKNQAAANRPKRMKRGREKNKVAYKVNARDVFFFFLRAHKSMQY